MKDYERWILLAIIIISLIPIWSLKYFPSQDGPMHLYNAHILKNYSAPETLFAKYFKINSFLLPNVLADLLLYLLLQLFPALLAEKLFLSLYVILFTCGIVYFTNSINSRDNLAIIAPIFIYNLFLLFGFYNFVLGIPLFLFALGYWFRTRNRDKLEHFIIANLFIFLLYLSHIYIWGLLIFAIIFIALILDRGRNWIKVILQIGPTVLISLIVYVGVSPNLTKHTLIFSPFLNSVRMMFIPTFLRYYSNIEIIFSASLTVFFILVLVLRKMPLENLNNEQRSLGLLVIILGLIYFICPYWFGAAGYINVRIPLFVFLLLVPLITIKKGSYGRVLAVIYVSIFTIFHVLHIVNMSARYNQGLDEFTSGIGYVRPRSIVLAVVIDRHGNSTWIAPYAHADNYYYLATGGINPYHQDGNTAGEELASIEQLSIVQLKKEYRHLRQIKFKKPLNEQQELLKAYDYILIWDKRAQPIDLRDFRLVHKTGRLLLYEKLLN